MIFLHPLITYVVIYCLALIKMFWGTFADPWRGNGVFVSTLTVRMVLAEEDAGLSQHSLSLFTENPISLQALGSSLGLSLTSGSGRGNSSMKTERSVKQWFQTSWNLVFWDSVLTFASYSWCFYLSRSDI